MWEGGEYEAAEDQTVISLPLCRRPEEDYQLCRPLI